MDGGSTVPSYRREGEAYTMHISIKYQDCCVVPFRERRTKCASMRVLKNTSNNKEDNQWPAPTKTSRWGPSGGSVTS